MTVRIAVYADWAGLAQPLRLGFLHARRGAGREIFESDYLLGVHDAYRAGALRLRLDDVGDHLDNRHGAAAPPFVQLRELEAASLALERDEDNTDAAGDEHDEGAWELVVQTLATNAGWAMRGASRDVARSVDRGTHRPAIEPRKN